MTLKKQTFKETEIAIFDDAIIYKRGDYWQFRIWLPKEHKYARFSLKTKSQSTAIDKAKLHYHELMALQLQGKSYFSITVKDGVEKYLKQRMKDVEVGIIVKGRYNTIKTHLEHWLDFIKRDTKLKELERTDCENYFYERSKTHITPRAIDYHFDKLLERAGIRDIEKRDLVPYSFRHYFITQRVNSNLHPAQVAEMCGTSITQIEKTYYHTSEEKMVSNALADYEYVNGVLVPK